MLVLSRKAGEKIHIGPDVTITVKSIHAKRVKIIVEAPRSLEIYRTELHRADDDDEHPALDKNVNGQPVDPVTLGGPGA